MGVTMSVRILRTYMLTCTVIIPPDDIDETSIKRDLNIICS